MRLRRSTQFGLFLIVCSLIVAVLRFALPFVWGGVIASGAGPTVPGLSLHGFWMPAIGYVVDGALAFTGLLGFLLLWRGRWRFGAGYASKARPALLGLIGGVVVLALWFATGLLLSYVGGLSLLAPWRRLLAFAATALLGFALFEALGALPLVGVRPVAGVGLLLGVAGGALALIATLGLRRTEAAVLRGAGEALSAVSLLLWLALSTWGWTSLRSRGAGPSPSAPSQAA